MAQRKATPRKARKVYPPRHREGTWSWTSEPVQTYGSARDRKSLYVGIQNSTAGAAIVVRGWSDSGDYVGPDGYVGLKNLTIGDAETLVEALCAAIIAAESMGADGATLYGRGDPDGEVVPAPVLAPSPDYAGMAEIIGTTGGTGVLRQPERIPA